MEENLVGYLLKALDDQTSREVESALRESPSLRMRLELLERGLAPLAADRETPPAQPSLVLATLARIAEHQCRKLPDAPPAPREQAAPVSRSWLRRPDALVAALLLIVLGGIGASSLLHLWRDYQGRDACKNSLQLIWRGLQRYCDAHGGEFPPVEENGSHGVAGIFVPVLRDSGMLASDVSVHCPAQPVSNASRRSVADLEELYQRNPAAFREEARRLTGGYAYSLGYSDGLGHHNLRRDYGDHLPILADRLESSAQPNSPNHGGNGQNVLYLGGHVGWHTNRNAGINGDDIFVNWDKKVLAGKALEDTVLAPGDASPMPRD